ncbi:hypothetical protein LP419_33280 [Massilia sp. H-1]|nr:hypothetical protein LP419_33280 [Massilia sp. H-1]
MLLIELLLQYAFLQARALDAAAGRAARVVDQFLLLAQLDFEAGDIQFRGQHVFAGHAMPTLRSVV